jgi:hypothetical protein
MIIIRLLRKKIPKPVLFIILRYAGYEFHFSEEVIAETDPYKILFGAAAAGNYKLYMKYNHHMSKLNDETGKHLIDHIYLGIGLGGNMDILKDVLDKINIGFIFAGACSARNDHIIEKLRDSGYDFNYYLEEICSYCDYETIKHYMDILKIPDYYLGSGLEGACIQKDTRIFEYLLSKGANLNQDVIYNIGLNNNYVIVDFLYKNHYSSIKKILREAFYHDNIEMIKYFVRNRYITMTKLTKMARQEGSYDLLNKL